MALAPEPYLSACLETLYSAIIHARVLGAMGRDNGLAPDDSARLDDPMDAVHNLPRLLTQWESADEQRIRDFLRAYDDRWGASTPVPLRLLDVYEREVAGAPGAG